MLPEEHRHGLGVAGVLALVRMAPLCPGPIPFFFARARVGEVIRKMQRPCSSFSYSRQVPRALLFAAVKQNHGTQSRG